MDGLYKATSVDYDAILLDLMLPGVDGWQVLGRLREARPTPVLILTARDAIDDRIRGLDAGADDYVVKPFSLSEVLARVRANTEADCETPAPTPQGTEVHYAIVSALDFDTCIPAQRRCNASITAVALTQSSAISRAPPSGRTVRRHRAHARARRRRRASALRSYSQRSSTVVGRCSGSSWRFVQSARQLGVRRATTA